MSKNIAIFSDGTGNTFGRKKTNVTRLLQCLSYVDHKRQISVYDQGVGTNQDRYNTVEEFRKSIPDRKALKILPPPIESRFWPQSVKNRTKGLLFGDGIVENVREMYQTLADLYEPDDRVFLFGFSRGAFTVRALAGLIYRCRLPHQESADFDTRFKRAWSLYEPIEEDLSATEAFCATQRPCAIHFLGLWDTVKSYGGLDPVILPHLRHNPIVGHVRHCLALDERRAWFKPTTWGLLDLDENGAMKRLKKQDLPLYEEQRKHIAEVWFRGVHSDIGGGYKNDDRSRIALRWMLGEAVNVTPGLTLNDQGKEFLRSSDKSPEKEEPRLHESWNILWGLMEQKQRQEIDNFGEQPIKKDARGSDGKRKPEQYLRKGKVYLHESVGTLHSIPGEIEICETKALPAAESPLSDANKSFDLSMSR